MQPTDYLFGDNTQTDLLATRRGCAAGAPSQRAIGGVKSEGAGRRGLPATLARASQPSPTVADPNRDADTHRSYAARAHAPWHLGPNRCLDCYITATDVVLTQRGKGP